MHMNGLVITLMSLVLLIFMIKNITLISAVYYWSKITITKGTRSRKYGMVEISEVAYNYSFGKVGVDVRD